MSTILEKIAAIEGEVCISIPETGSKKSNLYFSALCVCVSGYYPPVGYNDWL